MSEFSAPRLSTSSEESAPTDATAAWQLSDSVLLIIWIAGAALAFAVKHSQLLLGFDGEYMRDLARRQFEWGVPVWSASIDMYQGIGDIFFSGSNFTLIPSFIVGSWFGVGTAAKIAIYAVALTEYTLSIALFARALGLTKNSSYCSGASAAAAHISVLREWCDLRGALTHSAAGYLHRRHTLALLSLIAVRSRAPFCTTFAMSSCLSGS